MLHGFKEPTMPTGIEADADSHWNGTLTRSHQQATPTAEKNPFRIRGVTNCAAEALNFKTILNSTVIHASFNFCPIGPLSSFQAIAMALGPFLCMHRMVHCSSPQTEGIQSSREACPWHGAHLISTLSPHAKLTG